MSDCFDHAAEAWDDALFGRTADEGWGRDSWNGLQRTYRPPLPTKNIGKVEIKAETEKAWLISNKSFDSSWFPKSQCRLTPEKELIVAGWLYEHKLQEQI